MSVVKGQPPSRDNFHFLFENDFEDDQTGRYTDADYRKDWNFSSTYPALYEHEVVEIIKDTDTVKDNKFMRGNYPQGTWGPSQHGFSWQSSIGNHDELYFSYDLKFKPGFCWMQGGKLPGICGGPGIVGERPTKTSGFSVRLMWSNDSVLVFYVYHQNQAGLYGDSWGWLDGNELYRFTTGRWYNITMRISLNNFDGEYALSDGILEGWIDGERCSIKTGMKFRGIESIHLDRMYITSFFGGDDISWAPTRDEWIDFDKFVCWSFSDKAQDVPKAYETHRTGQTLLHPYYSFIIVDHPVVTVPSGLGDTSLVVTSSVDWSVSESVSWLTALKVNNDTLKISYDKNPGGPRQGKITLCGNGGKDAVVAVTQDSAPIILAKTIKINMYHKGYPAGTGWNDFSDWSAGSSLLLNDSLGNFSGYTIYNEDAWSGSNIYGMASGPYPQNVNKSYWLYSSGTTVDIEFRNLNDAHGYSLEFYGSIASGEKRQDRVTIGSKYDIIDVKSNTSDKAIFTSLSPSSGTIRASLTVESGGFGHLNAIVLREYKYDLELKSETSLQQSPPVVYPNPMNDFLQIRNAENVTRVELINIYGKTLLVKQNQKASTIRIDTKVLKDGIYILTLFDNSGTASSVKVVK